MKRIGFVLSIFTLVWMGVSALHLTNPYLRSSEFVEVSVIRGDSVWTPPACAGLGARRAAAGNGGPQSP